MYGMLLYLDLDGLRVGGWAFRCWGAGFETLEDV